ncbi:cytochrome b/b6 domain-containing protein [Sphingobium xenophagum]|jgi:cytochrome b|uniref:cytochrome b/b6 domain-containing protein n=1 Tax=Sphingomonadales TaxID=204457 RepID=UPI001C0B6643|nr:cytochrome b/b6 domain-containing protein [Sphingobium xenophagum]QWT15529.1 cytochrome b/b6 domain-containing protein [Sphingobium xenophagum]|tara:strand:+ start:39810 stop:40529 length:720 start_codon:yes stop_codon:yes gene_type:complete
MTDHLSAQSSSAVRIRVWDLPVRLFHWLLVATILVAFLSSEEDSALAPWHVPAGWVAAILIAFRLVWGFVGGEHARFSDFLKPSQIAHHIGGLLSGKPERSIGHNALGGIAIIALLGTVGGIAYSGAAMQGEAEGGLHETLANVLLGLIALHVIAVIAMSLLTKDNLIGAFITGKKSADLHPGVSDALPPTSLALPVAAIIIAGSAYTVTKFDPLAFTPGAHAEAGEGGNSERGERGND